MNAVNIIHTFKTLEELKSAHLEHLEELLLILTSGEGLSQLSGKGICLHADIQARVGLSAVQCFYPINQYFRSWEHFSGSSVYPVPCSAEEVEKALDDLGGFTIEDYIGIDGGFEYLDSEDLASIGYETVDLYEGRQLELRTSLLEHVIKSFKEEHNL